MSNFDLSRSDALHLRVQRHIEEQTIGKTLSESFDTIALALAKHQFASGTGVEKLYAARGISPKDVKKASEIPAVPTDVFKLRRVACHPPSLDEVVFMTSGTTLGTRGKHALRNLETYRQGARTFGKVMLCPDVDRLHWLLLAPAYEQNTSSSLGFMLNDFSLAFGASTTWAVHEDRLEIDTISKAVQRAGDDGIPLIVAGASFAFVHLLDTMKGQTLPLGKGARVMQTGGFKGKSRHVNAKELCEMLSEFFGVPSSHVVGEYGMTELGSQAYEGKLAKGTRQGVFLTPAWMRVRAVHPQTLEPMPQGEEGLARIEDLTNVDSAVAVQTADRIRIEDDGFVLLGRSPDATPRGCSIGIDEILNKNR